MGELVCEQGRQAFGVGVGAGGGYRVSGRGGQRGQQPALAVAEAWRFGEVNADLSGRFVCAGLE